MRKFPEQRITSSEIVSKHFKFPIPVVTVKPEIIQDDSCVIIFNGGLNCTNAGNLCLNHSFYDKHWFISFERCAHGNNKNKPSQFRTRYQKELLEVVLWTIKQFPNRKIYLLGESWGSAINFIFYKKHPTLVSGTVNWNMPMRPKDSEKNKGKVVWECAFKELLTLTTNITTYLPVVQKTLNNVTRNPLLLRALSMAPAIKQNSKTTIAVWRYMHSSKFFLFRYAKSKDLNYLYIQSGEDALQDKKITNKLAIKSLPEHFINIPTGYHILALEPVESNQLYKIIQDFIDKVK